MKNLKVDFSKSQGKVKPMHAVNNGPVYNWRGGSTANVDDFRAAGIPYGRTHDASFFSAYGGYHTVDVHAVFPDFDRDVNDPEAYDFVNTDEYLKAMKMADMEPFYRLGSKIEHEKRKYGTLPPKDFKKWAEICEHIIRHYNYGWADGFEMGITYWEIWNEPDLDPEDAEEKRTWGGTSKQFYELYSITANHLKKCFPELKIGGPASAGDKGWVEEFLRTLDAPLDFFSWHVYNHDVYVIREYDEYYRKVLDENGYTETESIMNEWNYAKRGCFNPETATYSTRTRKGLKGAAFTSAAMNLGQYGSIDMLMYYDAAPCAYNGLFETENRSHKLKGYYVFPMFNHLYCLGESIQTESDDRDLFISAAKNDDEAAIMVTYYNDDDEMEAKEARIHISGFEAENGVELEYYLLDEERDCELARTEKFTSNDFSVILKLELSSTMLIKIKKL